MSPVKNGNPRGGAGAAEPRCRWAATLARGALAIAAVVGLTRPAQADGWNTCATNTNFNVPANLGAKDFDPDTRLGTYANNTQYSWFFLTNPNVRYLFPYVTRFVTEENFDYLKITHAGGVGATASPTIYTGTLHDDFSMTWTLTSLVPIRNSSMGSLIVRWLTDYSVNNNVGPALEQFGVQCWPDQTTTPSNGFEIVTNSRYDGLLIGTGDTLYVNFVQPANRQMLITEEGHIPGTDFDISASPTVTLPTASTAAWKSTSGDASEAFIIPATAAQRTIYLAVHSFGGAGTFTLHAYETPYVWNNLPLTVCLPPGVTSLSSTDLSKLTTNLRTSSAQFLSATNGNIFNKAFQLRPLPSSQLCDCFICLQAGSARSRSSLGTPGHAGQVSQYYNFTSNSELALPHEWGHALLGLRDEYDDPPAIMSDWCGHSLMGTPTLGAFCSNMSHCKDGSRAHADCSNPSAWEGIININHLTMVNGNGQGSYTLTAASTRHDKNAQLKNLISVNSP
jgi:hypothetical protein